MIFDIIKEHTGLFQLLILLFMCISSSSCFESDKQSHSLDLNSTTYLLVSLSQDCNGKQCSEHQFCSENSMCECKSGFKNYGGQCVLCGGENENCTKKSDCCTFHFCLGGVCRRPGSNIEFITLTKVSLGITITIILAALFIFLMRGLINFTCGRYQQFHRGNEGNGVNAVHAYARQLLNQRTPSEVRQDKPPSYEECIRSSPRGILFESPPPYIISANVPPDFIRNERSANTLLHLSQNSNLENLNVQNLGIAVDQASRNSSGNKKSACDP